MHVASAGRVRIGIDTGGTFTDIVAVDGAKNYEYYHHFTKHLMGRINDLALQAEKIALQKQPSNRNAIA